jgi:hypothetical protein
MERRSGVIVRGMEMGVLRGGRQREEQQAKDRYGAQGKCGRRAGGPDWPLFKHLTMLK